jgi:hypothetical protein
MESSRKRKTSSSSSCRRESFFIKSCVMIGIILTMGNTLIGHPEKDHNSVRSENLSFGMPGASVVEKSESSLLPAITITSLDQAYQMSNMHENFPLECGQQPDWLHPAIKNTVDLVHNGLAPEQQRKGFAFGHGNHGSGVFSLTHLVDEQVCMYDVLEKWAELSVKLNISRWTAHGGAAISAKCHAAMNPWDDDIDLTVGDCTY